MPIESLSRKHSSSVIGCGTASPVPRTDDTGKHTRFRNLRCHEAHVKRLTPLTDWEVREIANRISLASTQPERDLALFYLMLTTGAKPLELARLRVKDVITTSGTVRSEAKLPSTIAINGCSRPVFFKSEVVVGAIEAYARHRAARRHGVLSSSKYGGLDPNSVLLLNGEGQAYEIVESSGQGHSRHLCRGILEACRGIFRMSGVPGLCGSTLRRTLALRLLDRRATIAQIAEALGFKDRSSVRKLLKLPRTSLSVLFDEIICADGASPTAVDRH